MLATVRTIAIATFLFAPRLATAHDIPNDVVVQSFLRPSGSHLDLLVRVPLQALRDISFPERPPGYLDLSRVDTILPDAATLWLSDFIELYEGDRRLPKPRVLETRISLPSDRSFTSLDEELAHLRGPKLPLDTNIVWNQAMLDVWFEYPIASDQSRFSIHPGLARLGLRVVSVLRFLPPGGAVRAFEFPGDPGLIRLDPRWYQAALQFVKLGFEHILDGTDHLLFLLCLVIPFRRMRALIPIVTAFTVAHSITLIASAYNLAPSALWFPPLVEALIAASIVYMALENIAGTANVQPPLDDHLRFWPGARLRLLFRASPDAAVRRVAPADVLALVQCGRGAGATAGAGAADSGARPALPLCRGGANGHDHFSAIVAHTAWHWMTDRWERLAQFRFEWPSITAAELASVLGWLTVLVFLAGLAWLGSLVFRRRDLMDSHDKSESRETAG